MSDKNDKLLALISDASHKKLLSDMIILGHVPCVFEGGKCLRHILTVFVTDRFTGVSARYAYPSNFWVVDQAVLTLGC